MNGLLSQIKKCDHCAQHLPLGPYPIVSFTGKSKIVLLSQAPGRKAHQHQKAWDDPSGKLLRHWLQVDDETFYNPDNFAILPMGFCYPGKGKTGDLPPRKECAPLWHERIWKQLKGVELVFLIGSYAQKEYLKGGYDTLTENVRQYHEFLPRFFPLPHPSPVNRFWLMKNPWFEEDVQPFIAQKVNEILDHFE
ncbi:MAG: uracil-DNA glycosylase family protein [Bacteroidota bacterium]